MLMRSCRWNVVSAGNQVSPNTEQCVWTGWMGAGSQGRDKCGAEDRFPRMGLGVFGTVSTTPPGLLPDHQTLLLLDALLRSG